MTATMLELVSVTVCGGEMVWTWVSPYDRLVGDTVGVAMMPTPDNERVCVGVTALSVITTDPVIFPV